MSMKGRVEVRRLAGVAVDEEEEEWVQERDCYSDSV